MQGPGVYGARPDVRVRHGAEEGVGCRGYPRLCAGREGQRWWWEEGDGSLGMGGGCYGAGIRGYEWRVRRSSLDSGRGPHPVFATEHEWRDEPQGQKDKVSELGKAIQCSL